MAGHGGKRLEFQALQEWRQETQWFCVILVCESTWAALNTVLKQKCVILVQCGSVDLSSQHSEDGGKKQA